MVKLDVDRLLIVPDAPPAAGPDRALDPDPVFAGVLAAGELLLLLVAAAELLVAALTMP
jgi:hypothetical protein